MGGIDAEMTFEAKLNDVSLLKDAIGVLYELIEDEVAFKFSQDGISMNAMDPANVSMAVFRLLSPAFESYKLKEETTIGIDMDKLNQVLKQSAGAEAMEMKLEDSRLQITFKGGSTRRFSIPLIDIDTEGKKAPKLAFDCSITLEGSVFSQGVSDAEIVSDSVLLSAEGEEFSMTAEGDNGKSELRIAKGEEALKAADIRAPCKARYAVDYLKKMIKGTKLSDSVTLQFKSDFPIQLEYVVPDKMQLMFVLAPRVEAE